MVMRPVLIVEHDPDVRALIRTALQLAGIPVKAAANGIAALATIEQDAELPALALVEAHMPLLDGPGLIHALASLGIELPVIMITPDPRPDRHARQLGTAGLVQKPFLLGQLMAQVKTSLADAA